MLFNSVSFLIFFPAFLSLYIVSWGQWRLWVTLIASNIFYAGWDWRFIPLIWFSTLLNYCCALCVVGRPAVLRLAIITNLALLGVFKYFNFFTGSFASLIQATGLPASPVTLEIILPIGISFYTFHCMSYLIDVSRREMKPEPNLLYFATYVTLFPQLVAGPIVRAQSLLPQIRKGPQVTWAGLGIGLEMVLWGYVLKLCLADNAGPYVDAVFRAPELSTHLANVTAVFGFAMQIYGDFAGYSLIAIGIGRMMGLDFGINFDAPYFSASFREFWHRWHISLSTWLRDYLFVPMGGSRGSLLQTLRNLAVTMLLGGLWHGASWTFVIWGALHGAYLIIERLIVPPLNAVQAALHLPWWAAKAMAVPVVFFLTCFAWIFFRAEDLSRAVGMIRLLVSFKDYQMTVGAIPPEFALALAMALLVLAVDFCSRSDRLRAWYTASLPWRAAGAYAMFAVILLFGSFTGQRFIYFQF